MYRAQHFRRRRLLSAFAVAAAAAGVVFGAYDRSASGAGGFDPTAAAPSPFGPEGWWSLAFSDEFDGSSLDGAKWHTCFWWATTTCSIESNSELELYEPDELLLGGGALHLRAERREATGWNGAAYHYTSGMVSSGGRKYLKPPGFTFTYGYAEARVRVPRGQGLWPAFWLLPASYRSRPEIDAMEILGSATTVTAMHVHTTDADGSPIDEGKSWAGADFAAGWHTFGVDWEPEAIVWYVDGVERWRFSDASVIPAEPMYVLANLAVGGSWPGAPDASTPFPSSYDIDYIRVWQREATPPPTVELVPPDASWRYLDDGSDQGTAWRGSDFDDGGWATGPAPLGYGQGDERTVVAFGPDPAAKYVTTYFRHSFRVADPAAISALTVRLRRDDGAIVYLNGIEVFRSNISTGPVDADTRANEALDDGTRVHEAAVDPALLNPGANVVAVETHQATAGSSDVTMQLELEATTTG